MKVGIILPTRGTLYTDVLAALLKSTEGHSCTYYPSSTLPTPEAFDVLTHQALQDHCHALWYVEEDTVPPPHALPEMIDLLRAGVGAVAVEYGLSNNQSTIVRHATTREILYCGLGCTLVSSVALKTLQAPYFRSDICFSLTHRAWESCDPKKQYGLYDVSLFTRLRAQQWKIVQGKGVAQHLTIATPSTPERNGSVHRVVPKGVPSLPSFLSLDPKEFYTIKEDHE